MSVQARRVISALGVLVYFTIHVYSADIANVQLIVASPDPVQAGTDVTFQTIIVNSGTEIWEEKSYMIEAELYGLKKEYLLKSNRVMGKKRVLPGGKSLIFVQLTIPEYFSGIYYYRIYIIHGTERIYTGKLTPMRVNPLPIIPPKPPAVKIGGNVILSYKSNTTNDWKDYTGNTSVNLVGRIMDRSILFNLYTIHDQDDVVDIYTILFNYYGSWVRIAIGDILPDFSELSVYGTGMRGVSWENQAGPFKTTLVGARLVESTEGTTENDGVYRRMMYAGSEEITLPWNMTLGMNGLYGADIESSVEIPGPTLKPQKNTASGGSFTWNGISFLVLKGQYEGSAWTENTKSTITAITDSAYRGDLEIETDPWTLSAYYQKTGPDFVSFGSPEATADRITMDVNTELYLFNFWSLSGGYNKFFDDLDDDPAIVRTTQQIINGGTSVNLKSGTGISTTYSINEVVGQDRTIQDNATGTAIYSISQSFWGQSIALSHQISNFRDKINPDSDLDTATNSINFNCSLGERFSGSLGANLTENKNISDSSKETSDSYTFSFNQVVLKDKLTLQLWGTYSLARNSDTSEDSEEVYANAELTYLWKSNISVTLGGSAKSFNDAVDPLTNTHETGANVRINYSF